MQAAGILTPLLMYADDIVLLASSVPELRAMNKVATDYAYANRYQFNGKKSNVMAFNASKALTELVQSEPWELFGEAVNVTKSYKYLGVDLIKEAARALARPVREKCDTKKNVVEKRNLQQVRRHA